MESLIEQAKEEVEILEYQHPNKFISLKQDLRAFISELEDPQNLLLKHTTISIFSETQESSTTNKRKEVVLVGGGMKKRCKTDAVLERAQQCLHKIRQLKTSLC
ncbi:uncharacterized protein LOC125214308 [Salvia hispanica]|uniref:uncharacterized protein LOC125214308 n=1 Tax=Salvia hispanica TaxID=49212 RepID=UPI00200959B7|nr:uncharacterized protein LOC125214308 [Salvia hispanica]